MHRLGRRRSSTSGSKAEGGGAHRISRASADVSATLGSDRHPGAAGGESVAARVAAGRRTSRGHSPARVTKGELPWRGGGGVRCRSIAFQPVLFRSIGRRGSIPTSGYDQRQTSTHVIFREVLGRLSWLSTAPVRGNGC